MKFNIEYIISLLAALGSSFMIYRINSNTHPLITFVFVPLLVAYLMIFTINNIFPQINAIGNAIRNYIEDKTMQTIDTTGYFQIFPPLMFVFVIFIILLYSRKLV